MKLVFQKPFKSIRALEPVDLPDFVVLTGVNGAGKSHLLEAIDNGSVNVEGVQPNPVGQGRRTIRRFDANSLITQDTGVFSGGQAMQEMASHWEQLNNLNIAHAPSFQSHLNNHLPLIANKISLRDLRFLDAEKLMALGVEIEKIPEYMVQSRNLADSFENSIVAQYVGSDPTNRPWLIERLKLASKGEPFFAIEQEEFFDAFPNNWQQVDLFQHSFSRLFSNYQRAWRENELRKVGKSRGVNLTSLSDDEFVEKHGGRPWDFLNGILEIAGIEFRVNFPAQYEDRPYEPILQDQKSGSKVKFADLSSGERVLMSFALCLYHVQDARANLEYPQVLLFDEIDAPLHPSMTSSMLKTIQQALVVEKGIKVILTTHSPSTVALCPEGSVFVMQKDARERVKAASRDSALGILTAGVPTLSVNYENRRQVFVESKYDVEFYSSIYQLVKNKIEPSISISFIASGDGGGHGSCSHVESIAALLREAGNKTIIGLVDWDQKNRPTDHVQVLGFGDRYAIDNYILDPLAVGLFLLREQFVKSEDFGFDAKSSYLSIAQGDVKILEIVANKVVDDLSKKLTENEKSELGGIDFPYSEGFTLVQPKWLAVLNGHRLELALKETYGPLLRFKNEGDLKNAIVRKVFTDRPGLIPLEFIRALISIQAVR